jgi:hypothetical protein
LINVRGRRDVGPTPRSCATTLELTSVRAADVCSITRPVAGFDGAGA